MFKRKDGNLILICRTTKALMFKLGIKFTLPNRGYINVQTACNEWKPKSAKNFQDDCKRYITEFGPRLNWWFSTGRLPGVGHLGLEGQASDRTELLTFERFGMRTISKWLLYFRKQIVQGIASSKRTRLVRETFCFVDAWNFNLRYIKEKLIMEKIPLLFNFF